MERKVYLGRHAEHENQILTNEGQHLTFEVGRRLGERHGDTDKITHIICSPRLRTVATSITRIEGYLSITKSKPPTYAIDNRIDSFESEGKVALDRLKAEAKAAGMEPEEALLTFEYLREHMIKRGCEGAQAIRDWLDTNPTGVPLFESHGGSRLEVTMMTLGYSEFDPEAVKPFAVKPFFERSAVAELTFVEKASGWVCTTFDYLGVLVPERAKANS